MYKPLQIKAPQIGNAKNHPLNRPNLVPRAFPFHPFFSVRHGGAHPGEHQHGVSIQISIRLGKTFLRISRIQNIPLT